MAKLRVARASLLSGDFTTPPAAQPKLRVSSASITSIEPVAVQPKLRVSRASLVSIEQVIAQPKLRVSRAAVVSLNGAGRRVLKRWDATTQAYVPLALRRWDGTKYVRLDM